MFSQVPHIKIRTIPGVFWAVLKTLCERIMSAARARKMESSNPKYEIESPDQSLDRPLPFEDKEGHFACPPGYVINGEYVVLDTLGEGSFGRVFEVQSLTSPSQETMALKVIPRTKKRSAEREINVHKRLTELDPQGVRNLCVRMVSHFEHLGHSCILMEKLGLDLFEFCDTPFPMDQIRDIFHQLCSGVHFLHQCGITHLDIKPENVAFIDSTLTTVGGVQRLVNTKIRILDVNGARFGVNKFGPAAVGTRSYMAPEMVLGLECWHPCDVWAVACVVYELYTGKVLFPLNETVYSTQMLNRLHLSHMVRVCGEEIPLRMIANHPNEKMFRNGKLIRMLSCKIRPLSRYMKERTIHDYQLFDLLSGMFKIDDEKRVSMRQALNHELFKGLAPAGK